MLALAAVAVRPLAAAAWTEYAVRAACPLTDDDVRALRPNPDFLPERGELLGGALDPWGRPFRYEKEDLGVRLWSAGPDGADQGGLDGDDVPVRETTLARRIDVAPRWFLGAAFVLLWLAGAIRARRAPRSARLTVEFARAAVIALGPIVGVVALAYPLSLFRIPALDAGVAPLAVSWPVAFAGTGALLVLLAALWCRTRRPPADDDQRARTGRRAWPPWVGVAVLVALAGGTTAWRDARRERWSGPRVLMLAQLGVPAAIEAIFVDVDHELRQLILANPPPVLSVSDATLARIAAVGPDALELMVGALAGHDVFRLQPAAIEFVRDHDPELRALAARIEERPELYPVALRLLAAELVTALGIRRVVGRLVANLETSDRRERDSTAQTIVGLLDGPHRPMALPRRRRPLGTDFERLARRIVIWWRAGAPELRAPRQLSLRVRGLPPPPSPTPALRVLLVSRGTTFTIADISQDGRPPFPLGLDEESVVLMRLMSGLVEHAAVPLDVPPEGCTVFVDVDWPTGAHEVRVVRHPD